MDLNGAQGRWQAFNPLEAKPLGHLHDEVVVELSPLLHQRLRQRLWNRRVQIPQELVLTCHKLVAQNLSLQLSATHFFRPFFCCWLLKVFFVSVVSWGAMKVSIQWDSEPSCRPHQKGQHLGQAAAMILTKGSGKDSNLG